MYIFINILIKNLSFQCHEIGDSLFYSSWMVLQPNLLKYWITVIQMSENPVMVHIPGILPILSLRYYSEVSNVLLLLESLKKIN